MGLFSTECSHCGSKEHASSDCPHGIFSSKCSHCDSTEHASNDCPHGIFSSKCSHCGSKTHASNDCPHGIFASKCSHCGSVEHASNDCPHGIFSSKCANCGSKNHSTSDCPQGLFGKSTSPSSETTMPYSSSSGDGGCGVIIAYIVGIIFAIITIVVVAIWLAINIVLPIALLNSALAFTILALYYKERKILFAFLALVGGCYMLIDIFGGWFSANFVNNVVGNSVWITCFVYLNAAAIGLSVWFLVEPLWIQATEIETSDKNKSLLIKVGAILLIAIAALTSPLVYHLFKKSFVNDYKTNAPKTNEVYYDIPAINARVTSFRLYESGVADLPPEERDYGKIFTTSQTRNVSWEVNFEYPSNQNRIDFTLKAIWYRSDGTVITEQTVQSYAEKGWNNSGHHAGYGSNDLGSFWQKGFYRVELYADGKKIAEASFEVRNLGNKKTFTSNSNDKDDAKDTDRIVVINSSNLIGTWEGIFGSNNAPSNIKIDKIEGNTFYGVLNKENSQIAFTGSMNPNTREITFKETKVISLGNAKDWKLGTNKGVFSNNGQTIKGKGEDGRNSYSWKFLKQ